MRQIEPSANGAVPINVLPSNSGLVSNFAARSPEPATAATTTNGNGYQSPTINENVIQYENTVSFHGSGSSSPLSPPPPTSIKSFNTAPLMPRRVTPKPLKFVPATQSSENFYTIERISLAQEQKTPNVSDLSKNFQQPNSPVRKPLSRTASSPTFSARPTPSPFSPSKTSKFEFGTSGRHQPSNSTASGEKLMISHGKPNFVINKKKSTMVYSGKTNGNPLETKEHIPKLRKVVNSVLDDDEKKLATPVSAMNFVAVEHKQEYNHHQQMTFLEEKLNETSISPSSSTTSSLSVASHHMSTPPPPLPTAMVAPFHNDGPNFEQKNYVSFSKDLAIGPNKYPDMVKVTKFVESNYANDEAFTVDGYDLRLVKIDIDEHNVDDMKVVKRE